MTRIALSLPLYFFATNHQKLDTCAFASTNAINTKARLYNKCPSKGGTILAHQAADYDPCSVLTYDILSPSSYWIVVRICV